MADWPDWSGYPAVIVGTGPSAASTSLHVIEGKAKVFAVKSSWRLWPFADALYGIDRGWWIANKGGEKFQGLKFSPSPSICKCYPSVRLVKLKARAEILMGETGVIGCGLRTGGGHSGFQATNLAIQFGARKIIWVGFDMRGGHWFAERAGFAKPEASRTESWRAALDGCAAQFASLGVTVVNATPNSALMNYPKVDLMEAIRGD